MSWFRLTAIRLTAMGALCALSLGCSKPQEGGALPGPSDVVIQEIVSVYDADTFRAALKGWPEYLGSDVGIRVRGIDAPEIRGKCALEKRKAKTARDYVRGILEKAHQVSLHNVETGKYFRLVADVYVDGESLAKTLIQKRHARAYDGGRRKPWCPS